MTVPAWHWINQPNAEEIKKKLIKTLRSDNWKGKRRDRKTLSKLDEGRRKWIKENPEKYQESRLKATRWMMGKGNPNWKGGISGKHSNRIKSKKWQEIRGIILKRDNYKCSECKTKEKLIVHHKNPYYKSFDDNDYNLIVLCRSCHMRIEKKLNVFYK